MIDGTVLTADNLGEVQGIRHGFFTREGGVSRGVYGTLNCGLGSDDTRADVIENRRRIAGHLGASDPSIQTVYQIHSADVVIVDAPFTSAGPPKADALVTATPGIAVGALTADCTPVLFADPQAGIVAAAHAGWRGAVTGVLEATLVAMQSIGAERHRIRAAIGPTISQANYEVGPEFEAQFLEQDTANKRFFTKPTPQSRPHFDLPAFCRSRLNQAGLATIEDLGRCTYADESLFFSYRRKTHTRAADYGRQISAIVVA